MSENNQKEQLAELRHSAAHLLAAAVLGLYPKAKLAIGPSIDEGFYYDIDFGTESLGDEQLESIENKMRELVPNWQEFKREEVSAEQAKRRFAGNPYKLELITDLEKAGEVITLYSSGEFIDLCRGGHVDQPKEQLKFFKLLSVAGAYWRGSEKNPMLTRIYGTAFFSQAELDEYLRIREEAKLRDHRKLGKELDLFTFSDLVGAGLPLWTPKGTLLRNLLDNYVWQLRQAKGYQKVTIPHITKKELYETSGHWSKFANDLFRIVTREDHEFAMKPMNCPHHTQIYNHLPRSYRDVPQRYAETTMVYRDEQTGELNGLSRVRCITQDDAHVFCRENQLKEEMFAIWDIIEQFYLACGFPKLNLRLSLSDPNQMEKYLGSREQWDMAEEQLRSFAKERGAEFVEAVGEAAFYGPKLDFITKDSLGREWQVATIQADRNMPERFDLFCINEAGEKERVVMIHAAIMGSIERFVSILIEHHAGKFPFWLAPVQVKILPITDGQIEYAQQVMQQLMEAGLRVEIDERSERLNAKIRDAQLQKVPYMFVVGGKEAESQSVAVRSRDAGDLGVQTIAESIDKLLQETAK
ncbi:MAG TPA: threonine--tRNA ligase [Candidatus Woesebacteria bacterium]|nr:threonine--tRNA ligase [Candidatus Woesebacteria bacterium]